MKSISNLNRKLGSHIRELRRQRGLPQVVLARLSRTSPSTISVLEKWGVLPNDAILQRITQVLELGEAELFIERRGQNEEHS